MFKYSLKKKTLALIMDGDIFPNYWGDSVDASLVRNAIAEYDGKFNTVAIDLTTNGGDVTVGMAIYTLLRDLVNKGIVVNIRVVGIAASMGSIIALAGTTLEISQGSWIMIHNPLALTIGDYREHESRTDMLKTVRDSLASIYEERSDLEKSELFAMMDSETWFSAEKAVERGFASKIYVNTDPVASANGLDLQKRLKSSIVAQNFKNIPEAIKNILPTETLPVSSNSGNEPAKPKGKAMDELNQLLASNPEAKAAYDKAIAEAKAPVATAPVAVATAPVVPEPVQQPKASISPEIVASSSAYPEQIRKMAVAALVNPSDVTAVASFNAVIAMHDVQSEQVKSQQAQNATAQGGETPPTEQNHNPAPTAQTQNNGVVLIATAEQAVALGQNKSIPVA